MLNTDLNIADPDGFYEALVDIHRDLTPEQSRLVNAKLVLLLANHIGDPTVLRQAMSQSPPGGRTSRAGRHCPGGRLNPDKDGARGNAPAWLLPLHRGLAGAHRAQSERHPGRACLPPSAPWWATGTGVHSAQPTGSGSGAGDR